MWSGVWTTARQDPCFEYKYFVYNGKESDNVDAFEWVGNSDLNKHLIINRCLNLSRKYFSSRIPCANNQNATYVYPVCSQNKMEFDVNSLCLIVKLTVHPRPKLR